MAFSASVKINVSENLTKAQKRIKKATEKIRKNFDRMSKSVAFAGNAFRKFSKFASFALIGLGVGFGALIKKTADFGDELDKTSQKTGIGAEQLQRLRYVAGLGGASIGDVSRSLKFLNRAMSEAGDGVTEYSDEFDALGVTIQNQDGTMRDTIAVYYDLADAMSTIEDGAYKNAKAQKVLGKAGEALIPTMNMGSEEIKRLGQDLKTVITDEEADDAAAFNDELHKLVSNLKAVTFKHIVKAMPALTVMAESMGGLSEGLNKFLTDNVDLGKVIQGWVDSIKGFDFKSFFEISTDTLKYVIEDLKLIVDGIASAVTFVKAQKSKADATVDVGGKILGTEALGRWFGELQAGKGAELAEAMINVRIDQDGKASITGASAQGLQLNTSMGIMGGSGIGF